MHRFFFYILVTILSILNFAIILRVLPYVIISVVLYDNKTNIIKYIVNNSYKNLLANFLISLLDKIILSCLFILFLAILSPIIELTVNYILISSLILADLLDYIVFSGKMNINYLLNPSSPGPSGNQPPHPGGGGGGSGVHPFPNQGNDERYRYIAPGPAPAPDPSPSPEPTDEWDKNYLEHEFKNTAFFETLSEEDRRNYVYKKIVFFNKTFSSFDKDMYSARGKRFFSIKEREFIGDHIRMNHPAYFEERMRFRVYDGDGEKYTFRKGNLGVAIGNRLAEMLRR